MEAAISKPVDVFSHSQKIAAEFFGTALLLATVVGSGIMADTLAGGNVAIALLGNTIATGAMLVVLITALGPISGAHFNPAVSLVFVLRKELGLGLAIAFLAAQVVGAVTGVFLAHAMFDQEIIQQSIKVRSGAGQWISEGVATFGLVCVILKTIRAKPDFVPVAVGLYITGAYWFTASTSFANPAVTFARSLTNTFSGIRPDDVLAFVLVQFAAAVLAFLACRFLAPRQEV
jgi:glycerol uptake facilitator-like aquaporin